MERAQKSREISVKRRKAKTAKVVHVWDIDRDDGEDLDIRDIAIRDANRAFERHVKDLRNSN